MTIIGLSGSLRSGSYNTMLLEAISELAPAGTVVEIASIKGIPLYDGDLESTEGLPPEVQSLKERLASASGLIIVTPEYNNSIPGVLKNALDWLSRPSKDLRQVFIGLPVAVAGATPGRGATSLAQAAFLPVLRTLGTRPFFERLLAVAGAADLFDEHRLHDEATRKRAADFVRDFAVFAELNKR